MKKIVTALFAALIAAPAGAADAGGYFALNVANGAPSIPAPAGGAFAQKSATTYGVALGYQMDKFWAVEAQYTGLGAVGDAAGNQAKGRAANFSMVGSLPLGEGLGIYGKVGLSSSKIDGNPAMGVAGGSRTGMSYGVGVQFDLAAVATLRAGWDRYPVTTHSAAGVRQYGNADLLGATLLVRF